MDSTHSVHHHHHYHHHIIIIRPRVDRRALSPELMISLVLRPLGRWGWQRSKRSCHFCANSYLVLENPCMQYGNDQNEISIKPSPWCLHWLPPLFRSVQNCLILPSSLSSSPSTLPSSPPPSPSSSSPSPYSSPTMTMVPRKKSHTTILQSPPFSL